MLTPVFDVAATSSSLIASRQLIHLPSGDYEIPRLLLLGQRGGGRPIRVAIFAGFDPGAVETTVALNRLLLQYELIPSLAKDYALFAYPIVNVQAFDQIPGSLSRLEGRFATDAPDDDVRFFRTELTNWKFDGLISLRRDLRDNRFHAATRSAFLGEEVLRPAFKSLGGSFPVRDNPVSLRPDDKYARLADVAQGKLTAPANVRPYPFEVELFAPSSLDAEQQVTGLFLCVQEILRNYRRLISHAQGL
jgi:hypothetical protein